MTVGWNKKYGDIVKKNCSCLFLCTMDGTNKKVVSKELEKHVKVERQEGEETGTSRPCGSWS